MKITCQSCQSKYNVADEKVQGKIVKIRCRKCGATIVVNGTAGAAANGSPAAPEAAVASAHAAAAGADAAQWHVNVGDNDQRTMTLEELVTAYNASVVTQDTFIWTDGMDDWKPLGEVDAVVSALHEHAGHAAAPASVAFEPAPPSAAAPAYEPPAPAPNPMPAFAAEHAAPAPEAKRAAVVKREARSRDLFGTIAGEEVQTSAPAVSHAVSHAVSQGMTPVVVDDGKLTGQRNENSVLFSLAVLTKEEARAPVPDKTTASREDSGLIDLKALAAKAESSRPPALANQDVFSAPLGISAPLGSPLGPVGGGAEGQTKSNLPLLIGGGAGVALLLVLGIVIGVKIAGSSSAATAPTASAPVLATATAEPSATASATAEAPSAAPSASVAAAKKPALGAAPGHPGAGKPGAPVGAGGQPPAGGGAPAAPPPAPAKKGDCGCNGDLMCLMKCSTAH